MHLHILSKPCYTAINRKQFNIYLDFIVTAYCGSSLNVYLIWAAGCSHLVLYRLQCYFFSRVMRYWIENRNQNSHPLLKTNIFIYITYGIYSFQSEPLPIFWFSLLLFLQSVSLYTVFFLCNFICR